MMQKLHLTDSFFSNITDIKHTGNETAPLKILSVDKDIIAKEIKNLDPKKAVPQDDIPIKLLKLNHICLIFSINIKGDDSPVHIKDDSPKGVNYKSGSILSIKINLSIQNI